MNKAIVIGIVGSGIVMGIFGILSLDSFSIIENNDESTEPILGESDSELEPKPQGRDLSIELDEKMGLSAP